jgi:hypothetical protein
MLKKEGGKYISTKAKITTTSFPSDSISLGFQTLFTNLLQNSKNSHHYNLKPYN